MSEYNGAIANLLQGVSQQARLERRPEQLEEQINCFSSVTKGNGSRPGTQILTGKPLTDFPEDSAYYVYDRGDTLERYSILGTDEGLAVTDLLTGDDVPVVLTGHTDYLASTNPDKDLRFHTIADTTFILNKDIEPEMQNPTDSSDIWQAIVYCKRANWGFDYEMRVGGTLIAKCRTPSTITLSTSTTDVEQSKNITLKTAQIVECMYFGATIELAEWLGGYTGGIAQWASDNGVTASLSSAVLYLTHPTASFELEVNDDNNGNDLTTFGQAIAQYSDLPRVCQHEYKVKVGGVDNTIYNDYYVTFDGENESGIGYGVWRESAGFDVTTEFDPSTMPHIFTREYDDASGTITGTPYGVYFNLAEIPWVARKAGDEDTNPDPSFVGREISDILTYQGRLVLVSEENVVTSVTFDHYNMFAETVTQESPADPIDTASSDNQVTNLHHALVFNASLLLFSDKAQFVHPSDTQFTTETFGLSSKTRYENVVECSPVASATSVFFPFQAGLFTGIREMQVESVTGNILVNETTGHIDHYIPGKAAQLVSSTDYNILLVRTDSDETGLYVFQWFNQDQTRVQAAWHRWDFGYPIKNIAFVQDKLYIWKEVNNTMSIEYIDMADTDTESVAFPVRLDHTSIEVGVSAGDYWEIDASGYLDPTGRALSFDDLLIIAGDDTGIEGAVLSESILSSTDTTKIWIPKQTVFPVSTPSFIIGCTYTALGDITNPYVRDNSGRAKTKGKLRLKSMKFNCSNTGSLDLIVQKTHADDYTKEFRGQIIEEFVLDVPPELYDIELTLPIRSDANRCNIRFSSSSHMPFYINNIDWSGSYYETGRRTV